MIFVRIVEQSLLVKTSNQKENKMAIKLSDFNVDDIKPRFTFVVDRKRNISGIVMYVFKYTSGEVAISILWADKDNTELWTSKKQKDYSDVDVLYRVVQIKNKTKE